MSACCIFLLALLTLPACSSFAASRPAAIVVVHIHLLHPGRHIPIRRIASIERGSDVLCILGSRYAMYGHPVAMRVAPAGGVVGPVPNVRRNFPETWLWADIVNE